MTHIYKSLSFQFYCGPLFTDRRVTGYQLLYFPALNPGSLLATISLELLCPPPALSTACCTDVSMGTAWKLCARVTCPVSHVEGTQDGVLLAVRWLCGPGEARSFLAPHVPHWLNFMNTGLAWTCKLACGCWVLVLRLWSLPSSK